MHTISSKRWCPTPEQVMILEELYTRGLRTPNAAQIQKITAHLAVYGRIQGKNVFYWFQNHKARDRQKLRRKIQKQLHQNHVIEELELAPPCNPFFQNLRSPTAAAHLPYLQHYPAESVGYQGARICDEGPEGVARRSQAWPLMISYGPIFPCCNRSRPLRTLPLFPIRSDEETGAS